MTDLDEFGELVRAELGDPPPEWSAAQRRRLKGLDLEPRSRAPRAAMLGGGLVLAAACIVAVVQLREPGGASSPSTPVVQSANAPPRESPQRRTIWFAAETRAKVFPLADESTIELQPGGRGRLEESPSGETRFDLHGGRATFRVRPREHGPFAVIAGEYRIEVVGTRFTVDYYPADHLVVAVEEGIVEVDLPARAERVRLAAGETLETERGELSVRSVAPPDEAAPAATRPAGSKTVATDWRSLYREGKVSEACARVKERSLSQWKRALSAAELVDLSATLRSCGDSAGALSALEAVRARFAGSAEAHEALFLMGRIEASRGRPTAAITNLESYVAGAPSARFATEALGRLVELHSGGGNVSRAKELAGLYLQRAPNGPYQALANDVLSRAHP